MAFIVPDEIERYAEEHTTPPDPLLAELAAETRATLSSPQMLTGPIEGRFLSCSSTRAAPGGCSSSAPTAATRRFRWPPRCPRAGGSTCELDPVHADVARRYIARSPYGDRITVHVGPAIETIGTPRR